MTNQVYFEGSYIDAMRDAVIAALLSGEHACIIGAPGFGKTDVAMAIARDVHPDNHKMLRITSGMKEDEINGAPNIGKLINESQLIREVTGTAYDPNVKMVLVDEFGRASSMIYTSLMYLTDRKNATVPVVATSNFMPTDKAAEALLDRLGLWCWVNPTLTPDEARKISVAKSKGKNRQMSVRGKLPTADEIAAAYAAQPGDKAIEAVADVIFQLSADAIAEGYTINPRRVSQWENVLFRVGFWLTGDADFDRVPDQAIQMLRFCFPLRTQEEAEKWGRVVAAMADPVQVVIDEVLSKAAAHMNGEIDKIAAMSSAERMGAISAAGASMARFQSELLQAGPSEPRVQEALRLMTSWFGNLARGEKIQR